MIPKAIAFAVSLISQNPISEPPGQLSADAAVRLMLQNHPRVQALVHEVRAAERGIASARALANPEITVTPGFTREGSDEELRIAQPLEINGARAARTGVASARLRAVREQVRLETIELVFQTRTAFSDLARAEERRKLSQELLTVADELDRIAQRQVEIGTRAGVEQIQTRIEVHRARQQASLAEADWQAARASVKALIRSEVDSALPIGALAFAPAEVVEADLVEEALASHPSVAMARAEQAGFLQEARLARADGLPDVTPHFRMASFTREPKIGGFGVGISFPLIDYGSRRNRILQAEESAKSQELRLAAAQVDVRQAVSQAVARIKAAEAVLLDYQSGLLEEAKRLFDATRVGFQVGQSNIAAMLEAQRTLRAVQTEYIDALVSHEQAKAQLDRATGRLPEALLPNELRKKEVER